ncbi:MAG: nuclear transport factor 2 family protein [Candidatus Promineifilaceae bacterium]
MVTNQQDRQSFQEVIQAEREWVEAHRRLDIDALERLMADEYKHIRADGVVAGKEADLASYQTGDRYWEFAESDEYDVQLYGQTAVLIGRWRARGVNAGERFDYAARFISVYVKRHGRWQMVAAQSTPIAGAEERGSGGAEE